MSTDDGYTMRLARAAAHAGSSREHPSTAALAEQLGTMYPSELSKLMDAAEVLAREARVILLAGNHTVRMPLAYIDSQRVKQVLDLPEEDAGGRESDVAADVIITCRDEEGLWIALVERSYEPFKGMWALPGGFIHTKGRGESPAQAARREAREETGLDLDLKTLWPVGFYAEPERDPRGWVGSMVFMTRLPERVQLKPGSDAKRVQWHRIVGMAPEVETGFDHDKIVEDGLRLYGFGILNSGLDSSS